MRFPHSFIRLSVGIVYREIFRTAITSRIVYHYSIIIKITLLILYMKKKRQYTSTMVKYL